MNEREIIMALKTKYPIAPNSTPREISPMQQRAVNCIGRLLVRALHNGHRRCIPRSGGKTEWLILLCVMLLASCASKPIQIARAYPIAERVIEPPMFVICEWDFPTDEWNIRGYNLYLGKQSHVYYPPIKMDWEYHLHRRPMVPILNNNPVLFIALSAYNNTFESPLTQELVWYRDTNSTNPPNNERLP